jgi:hypothetical protein
MIRTLLSLEGHVADEVEISERDVNRVERGVRDGKSRDEVCAGVSKAGPPAGTATSAPPGEPPCPVGGLPLVAGATTSSGLTGSVPLAPASPPRRCHRRPSPSRATDEMADVLPFAGTVLVEQRAVMTVRHLPAGARSQCRQG